MLFQRFTYRVCMPRVDNVLEWFFLGYFVRVCNCDENRRHPSHPRSRVVGFKSVYRSWNSERTEDASVCLDFERVVLRSLKTRVCRSTRRGFRNERFRYQFSIWRKRSRIPVEQIRVRGAEFEGDNPFPWTPNLKGLVYSFAIKPIDDRGSHALRSDMLFVGVFTGTRFTRIVSPSGVAWLPVPSFCFPPIFSNLVQIFEVLFLSV